MTDILNPILPGFHPDPSILRVGDDYYIATSTFEWWPGVRIHHSRDLVNWRHCAYAITRKSQLDIRGNADSCGVWAPCLSYREGLFYLIYTNVRSMIGAYKDTHNYLVTAPSIEGPWSEPIYMNSSGFDPSLFHDDDGRSWFLNMLWGHPQAMNSFAGILLQEYSHAEQRLIGPVRSIFDGTSLAVTEGPHLYRREGWYFLMTAEGGTFYQHAVTVARSRSIAGPYEVGPHPVLTSNNKPHDRLQRAGHASLVETQTGEWYLAHLCGRPIEWQGRADNGGSSYANLHCVLGRETALQRMEFTKEGWLQVAGGDNAPQWRVAAPNLPQGPKSIEPETDHFDAPKLSPHFNSLRVPAEESWLSLKARPGFLRLYGRESLHSLHEQSLIARRQQAFRCEAETVLEFAPQTFQQMAGLVAYYNTKNHAHLRATFDDKRGRVLGLIVSDHGVYREEPNVVELGDAKRVWLKVRFDLDRFQFSYATQEGQWRQIGPQLSAAMLSDEYATQGPGEGRFTEFGFTGNFLGLACQDLSGRRLHADFDYFAYREFD